MDGVQYAWTERAPFCIGVLDADGNITSANNRFIETMGDINTLRGVNFVKALVQKEQTEIVGKAITECRSPDTDRHLSEIDTLVLSQGMPMYRRFEWTIGQWDVEGCLAVYGTMTTIVDD